MDGRSDIFSLGAVVYEMVTGKRAFEGKSPLSVISAILEKEPEPISALKPPILDRTIQKCLAKQPDQRWQSASDLATQLTWASDASSSAAAAKSLAVPQQKRMQWLVVAAVLLLALLSGAGAYMLAKGSLRVPRVMRFSINLPAGDALGGTWWWNPSVAISRDGTQIAYVAHLSGTSQI